MVWSVGGVLVSFAHLVALLFATQPTLGRSRRIWLGMSGTQRGGGAYRAEEVQSVQSDCTGQTVLEVFYTTEFQELIRSCHMNGLNKQSDLRIITAASLGRRSIIITWSRDSYVSTLLSRCHPVAVA